MKIIKGDYAGSKERVINTAFRGRMLEIRSGVIGTNKYQIPEDLETIKLLHKDEKRTTQEGF